MSHHLTEALMAVGILTVIWSGIYFVIKVITDYTLKKKMIDKGYVDEESQALFKKEQSISNNYASLKWGLITFCAGLALILLEFIPYEADDSPLPFGLIAIFVATGFLIYYFLVKNKTEQ
ncbi:hypothetical protein QQ020_09520 [Fulvivirgaceae bacterium BMA12]|uniref:DUF6249 domain-containing protein n=1 Tax=Agaribacillus aureus TaxID=3051825 RepID=A0ABT8L3H6_9BACT|nr:hypothetical protein [Fulvivirgaceae bacterium BMA12]